MELTTALLALYVGGQMEIQNQGEGYLFRGEVESIAVEEGELRVHFAWLARGEGFPPVPNQWVKDDRPDYVASLEIYTASDIGPSAGGGASRIHLNSSIVGETAVLYPPDGSKLDRSRVEGLQ